MLIRRSPTSQILCPPGQAWTIYGCQPTPGSLCPPGKKWTIYGCQPMSGMGAEITIPVPKPEIPGYVTQEKYASDLGACQTGELAYRKQVQNKGYYMLAGGAAGGLMLGWLVGKR